MNSIDTATWLKKICKYRWVYLFVRRIKYTLQFFKRGFSDRQLWSLDVTIAEFALPRLQRFKEINSGLPFYKAENRHYTEEEWCEILNKMIFAMEYIKNLDQINTTNTGDEYARYQEGITLFATHFIDLWD
jgi:hypothetical protein